MNEDQSRREALNQIIDEGNEIERFLGTPAWDIIKRTLKAQSENYKIDCFEAAKDSTKNLANFLGRCEGVEWVLTTIERSFLEARDQAARQRLEDERGMTEQRELDEQVSDTISTSTYSGNKGMI